MNDTDDRGTGRPGRRLQETGPDHSLAAILRHFGSPALRQVLAMLAAGPLLVASRTRDPALVAGAVFAGQLPWLLISVISGVYVDRLDRRHVIVLANVLQATTIGAGLATGRLVARAPHSPRSSLHDPCRMVGCFVSLRWRSGTAKTGRPACSPPRRVRPPRGTRRRLGASATALG